MVLFLIFLWLSCGIYTFLKGQRCVRILETPHSLSQKLYEKSVEYEGI